MWTVERFVPLAFEEFGRMGGHAEALMHEVAEEEAARRDHLMHLPYDGPDVRRYKQVILASWRQRMSIAINCVHAMLILERNNLSSEHRGIRLPSPKHILNRY